jgi:putative phosphonate catabolism associated alcohol dehydrogenase
MSERNSMNTPNDDAPRSTRVALFHGPGQVHEPGKGLQLRSIPLPVVAAGEVLVRVRCCTLCGSDVHTHRGARTVDTPTVLGHEIVGEVVETGGVVHAADDTRPLVAGDRVTWTLAASCGRCDRCRAGLLQKCRTLFKYGHQLFTEAQPLTGGLAEHCTLVPGTAIFRVPEGVVDTVAAMANCATATVAAAFRTGGECRGQTVLVQGAGALGLMAAAMAAHAGAREVIVCDPQPKRLELAREFGATVVVELGDDPAGLKEAVGEATDGEGVVLALELCGAPAAMQQGLELLAIGGRYVWVGAVFPCGEVAVDPEQIVRRLITISGIHNYLPNDLATALEFLDQTRSVYPFSALVAETFPLSRVYEAFERARQTTAPRIAVVPD